MARRGNNIYKRKDGRWEGRYKSGYRPDGKAKYSSVYGKSYSAVKETLDLKRSEMQNIKIKCNMKISEAINLWLSDVKQRVKLSTYSNYIMKINKHILPYFANVRYDALTAKMLNDFIAAKLESGLSAKYTADIIVLIKTMANFLAKNYGYTNRVEFAALPKRTEKSEKLLLDATQQKQLRSALLSSPTASNAGILLAMSTGIRIGELCALKWSDIDLEKKILTVNRTMQRISNIGKKGTRLIITSPKSRSSVRSIPLPDFIIPVLKSIKADNDSFLLSGCSKITEPRTMQYRFKSLLKKLGLPEVRFHATRHIFATSCIEAGFDVKTLSEILGHSSAEITLNLYVHSSMERKFICMKLLSDRMTA